MTTETSDEPPAIPSRILIILLGAIGDVVRALPLLGCLRRAWPQTHIAWAVEPKSMPIIEGHPWLDELIVYDRRRAPWSFVPFLRRVRAGRFDLVIDLQRHLKSGIIGMASRAPERIGFAAANTKEFNHRFTTRQIEPQPNMRLKLTQYQAFADALGVPSTPIEFGLSLPPAEDERARATVALARRPIVAVFLGSSWPSRVYFPQSVAAVIRDLARPLDGSPALFPVLIGGPEDTSIADAVARELAGAVESINLVGRTRLRDLIAIFSECAVAFGPDCGPMHIAAAVGCPVVSLWGATAPERSAPWGNADFVMRGEIPCHPCYLRDCPIGRECMWRIAPNEVAAMVRRALRAGRTAARPMTPHDNPNSDAGEVSLQLARRA
jgi:lipopolysaccharide heptosyltransferase II